MKKSIIYVFISLLVCSAVAYSNNSEYNLALRNLKLGNTYREAGNYNTAIKYIEKAQKVLDYASDWESKYWSAAANEYLGYVYRDINMNDEAEGQFEIALAKFNGLIRQADGSPIPLQMVKNSIAGLKELISHQSEQSKGTVTEIGNSKGVINLDNSKLKTMPAMLPEDLVNLSMVANRLREFPASFSNYPKLRYLNLADNRISKFECDFTSCKDIKWIDLSNNRIKAISPDISKLTKLEYLDLSGNKLKTIPTNIEKLNNLKVLNLKDNKIPFDEIKNLIRNMPNTNILHDEYMRKENNEEIEQQIEE